MFRYEQCFSTLTNELVKRDEPLQLVRKLIASQVGIHEADIYFVWRYKIANKDSSIKPILKNVVGIADISNGKKWQWHHVIPSTHIRSLFNPTDAQQIIDEEMPCVLINQQTEHVDYNLFSGSTFRMVANLPATGISVNVKDRLDYISKLRAFVPRVYHNDVLRKLAYNVLNKL